MVGRESWQATRTPHNERGVCFIPRKHTPFWLVRNGALPIGRKNKLSFLRRKCFVMNSVGDFQAIYLLFHPHFPGSSGSLLFLSASQVCPGFRSESFQIYSASDDNVTFHQLNPCFAEIL
jgi:hypothetical protein